MLTYSANMEHMKNAIDASGKFDVEDSYFEFDVKDLYSKLNVDDFLLHYFEGFFKMSDLS